MKIHEYQAKTLLRGFGVPVPDGRVVFRGDEARDAALQLDTHVWVVKAQIHAGGRGKGGGVKLARSASEAESLARSILGMQLVTHQTGPEGKEVKRVYIEAGVDIARELYLGMVLDRETSRIVVMMSSEGGMEIEEVAASHPEKILKVFVDPAVGLQPFQARLLGFSLGLSSVGIRSLQHMLLALYEAFVKLDCSLLEINPLVVRTNDELIALDAKMTFDDNALFRHKELQALRDLDEEDPLEIQASKYDLSYIKLDGDIGCLVNGAGLAMATMDIIKQVGKEPANFLDVGGGADEAKVTAALQIILSDNVKGIFINIFGGIMKCDTIAKGVVAAAQKVGIGVPLVVRLEGTNVEEGKRILEQSDLNIITAPTMLEGARRIAEAVAAAQS
ncbi:MAG: ADP-forming succinate--CoA ligase subunit beta [Myxococcales bacterium]|nr:ADP-forming succinate--CoA ligase subunit beta [Myxococcales bacterium]